MKKTFRIVGLACAAIALLPLASCGGDDDGGDVIPPGQDEIEKETGMRLTKAAYYYFDYDNEGRCIGFELGGSNGDGYEINWKKGTMTELNEDDYDEYPEIYHFKTNGKGYITQVTQSWKETGDGESWNDYDYGYSSGEGKADFSYDKSGHLTKIKITSTETGVDEGEKYKETSHGEYNLTWRDGNLISVNVREEEVDGREKEIYEYDYEIAYGMQTNEFKQWSHTLLYEIFDFDFMPFGHVGMFGVGTAVFPIELNETYYENGNYVEADHYSIDIRTNDFGLISSEKGNWDTYYFSYDDVDTRSAFNLPQRPAKKSKSLFHRHRKTAK